MASNNGIVRLNVGGKIFHTTSQTLCKEPDSFLARFCEVQDMQPSVKDESGAFFIDRDPRYFRIILNYMRSDVIDLEDNVSLDAIAAEADFYALSDLTNRLEGMRRNPMPKSACSVVKTVCVTTHLGAGRHSSGYVLAEDESYTKFVSSHAEVLALIASTEKIMEIFKYYNAVKTIGDKVLVEDYILETAEICDILGRCGLVLRHTKEKSANDVEFHFSSV